MRKRFFPIICSAMIMTMGTAVCANATTSVAAMAKEETSQTTTDEDSKKKSLNEIRFDGWGEKEWSDNEYIRTLRKHIDAHNRGETWIINFIPYNEYVKGKFVICYMNEAIYGGANILFFFIDNPSVIFSAWVYSSVDIEKEVVTGYEVREVWVDDENSGITKEQVLKDLEARPEIIVW